MTWYEVLETTKDEYDLLEEWWTPAGKAGSGTVSKKEFQNYINKTNQIINNLKIKSNNGNGSTSTTSTSSSSSSTASGHTKKCFDCGKQGVMINHPGCPNKGERLHVPEHFKQKGQFKKPGSGGSNSNSNPISGTCKIATIPASDEKMENGEKFVYCRTCTRNDDEARWFKSTHPKAHKTAEHKRRDQLVATTNPHSLISQVVTPTPTIAEATTMDSEDKRDFERVCNTTGIPLEVLKANFKQKKAISKPAPTVEVHPPLASAPMEQNDTLQPSGTLSFQLNLTDKVSEFHACDTEEFYDLEEGPEVSQHWFEQCNLPPPGTATEDDNVSTTSDCSDFSDDFFDCDDYFPLDEDPIEPKPANLEPLSVPFSMWFNVNNFGFEGSFSFLLFIVCCLLTLHDCNRTTLIMLVGQLLSGMIEKTFWSFMRSLGSFLSGGPSVKISSICYPSEFLILS